MIPEELEKALVDSQAKVRMLCTYKPRMVSGTYLLIGYGVAEILPRAYRREEGMKLS